MSIKLRLLLWYLKNIKKEDLVSSPTDVRAQNVKPFGPNHKWPLELTIEQYQTSSHGHPISKVIQGAHK